AIIVTTGFRPYAPAEGEYGFGSPGVVTLPEFEKMVSAGGDGPLSLDGREIRSIAYIYCVGSRQEKGEGANLYCSRYCCNAAVHASTIAADRSPAAGSYHIYRDIRTYGKFEELYEKASGSGSVFLRFDPGAPPVVERNSGGLVVKVNDLLTEGEEIEIPVDLVVLVTGMVPAENEALTSILRLPLGSDRFYNEIHTKLRPVETVIDGVYIGGCAQGPKNATESVISSLSAVSKAASLLVKGYVDLQPFVAFVREDICEWCGKCESACPYSAISMVEKDGRKIAMVTDVLCKGCGACLPVCPVDATQLKGFTDDQVEGMIDGFAREVVND
ncbi:MAG TPA: 4Fe-4S dicluster-binding protein, partial [Candidatus Krumholzibacterium sp.]|nr:4Fe-4S dicluster-binding protein [Candidatus Krumholzibacterium sp.]